MNKELVPPELYFELRDLGIEPYKFVHKAELETGIFYSQAFRWFREKHGLHSYIEPSINADDTLSYEVCVYPYYVIKVCTELTIDSIIENTYEEAELACLKKLIEIVKNK